MPVDSRRFTNDDVTDIVRRALEGGGQDDVTYDELEDIARQSGVSPGRLRSAIEEHDRETTFERAREEWKRRRKAKFFHHLRAYCIVNGILLLINLFSDADELWVIWPILGWGFGIAFDAADAFFPKDTEVERGARKILRTKAAADRSRPEHYRNV